MLSFFQSNISPANQYNIKIMSIYHPPPKKVQERGVYAVKNVLFTCFFLGFPREKFYTPRSVRGGGWKMDGVDKGSSNHPPQFDTFCTGFGIPGVPGGFKPLSLYTFYVRVGQPFRGHPQDSSVFHEPPGLYILRACVYFWIFIGQLEFTAPLVLYFSCFLDTQVAELKKKTCLICRSPFFPKPFLATPLAC